jgi:chitin disaccharide deacetylase
MRKAVVLCADDFGLTPGVSRAILDLAERGRISATSAMTTLPHWPRLAPALRQTGIAIGLHLNLTAGPPLGPMPRLAPAGLPPLGRLLRAALLGHLPAQEVADEIARQLDAFERVSGRPPDFVDGHQHVHVLPTVRPALLAALARRGLATPPSGGRPGAEGGGVRGPWLRDPSDRLPALARRPAAGKALVAASLARGLARDAARAGLAVNRGFSGFSAFSGDPARVAATFARALDDLGPAPVVMCHPGVADDADLAGLDPVAAARPLETAYLASDAFTRLMEERGLVLAPRPSGR